MAITVLKRLFVGSPLATAQAKHERLGKIAALAIFCSDALSSVAYGPEEIRIFLALAGTAALAMTVPIALAITMLIAVVSTSYWQTIHAYPAGGGAYTVAKENLGTLPGLVAGASLLVGYVLTVAVSVAAGVAAITSAFPVLYPLRVGIGMLCVTFLCVVNLRGIRETARVFAVPTYWFVLGIGVVIGGGLIHLWRGGPVPEMPAVQSATLVPLTTFLVLRAFSAGCTALTGIEAVANCVQAFRPPETRNAGITLIWMAAMLGSMFMGLAFLSDAFNILPREGETLVSQLAAQILGRGPVYLAVQASTMIILLLAANTCYAGFPMLSSLLAKDGYLPRQFASLGDRLVYSNGILILSGLSMGLLIAFQGDTHALLPLYALGVFLSFTLSQLGMVRRWARLRESHWMHHAAVNLLGAFVTAIVLGVVGVTRFVEGAWMVVVVIPALVVMFYTIRRHYVEMSRQIDVYGYRPPKIGRHPVVVLVGGMNRGVIAALTYARAISPNVTALTVDLDSTSTARLQMHWPEWAPDVPLVVLDSPYRSVIQPILQYVDKMEKQRDGDYMTIILPEFVPAKWWQHLLHNQTALLIKAALLFRRGKIAISIPYHLGS
ncbi:MAG: ydaO [candidate division NC10 bacterium]|jgi:amino acid transporter|nr:ydaO [candidate division NC10 bacterium]